MTPTEAIDLLRQLIRIPSHSRNEGATASLLQQQMQQRGFDVRRFGNNLLAYNLHFDPRKKTVVLCSHHDTVPPNGGYTLDPYTPVEQDGRLYGLGSNDAGASLVSMFAAFSHFYERADLRYNLALLLCAEEECSGSGGVELVYPHLHRPELVVVGEPTDMNVAVAERGLVVLDCCVDGVSGHTANENTINPIVLAMDDIRWFSEYQFPKISEVLGPVRMSVNVVEAGSVHNVVPAVCRFVVDVRSNGCYSNAEVVEIIRRHVGCRVEPRSLRLGASQIPQAHPFVQCCVAEGAVPFGSPTMSDQALVSAPSVKIGVGSSSRSHTADEWIGIAEIEEGIEKYIQILTQYIVL